MELALLGPLEATGPFGPVLLRGAKERALLALLAVRPNEVVSTAHIIDGLWGDDPPPRAAKGLHSHVAHVRRALEAAGEPECLLTRDPGYLLRIDPDAIDAVRFERPAEEGRRAL